MDQSRSFIPLWQINLHIIFFKTSKIEQKLFPTNWLQRGHFKFNLNFISDLNNETEMYMMWAEMEERLHVGS